MRTFGLMLTTLAALSVVTTALPSVAASKAVPTKVGQCVSTTIKEKFSRLEGLPDSGDSVEYGNGIYGVSYDEIPELRAARNGDKVKLCLVSLPKDCPAGDDRGRHYKATDIRTGKGWELSDAEHECGGA